MDNSWGLWLVHPRGMLRHDMPPNIHDLYPDLTEKELVEAEANLERYLALVLRIFERAELETAPQADPLAPGTVPVS